MVEKKKLEVGEKYLSVQILGGQIKLVAFKNKDKAKPTEPDYRGEGIAIWINEKKPETQKVGFSLNVKDLI